MKIFDHEDYKTWMQARLAAMPKAGRGEFQRIARALRMHSTRVSRIFRGAEHLTLEQASELATDLGLDELEPQSFVARVSRARAGNEKLRRIETRRVRHLREQGRDLSESFRAQKVLSESDKALFYSQWYYSAARLLTSLEDCRDLDSIAARLGIPHATLRRVLDFLVRVGLCVEKKGRYSVGTRQTHLPPNSPVVDRLHANWRLKAMERHPTMSAPELAFTAPMSIRSEDLAWGRGELDAVIRKLVKRAAQCEAPEELACLNVDWVRICPAPPSRR